MRISKLCYLGFCSIALTIGLLSCTDEPAIVAVSSVTLDPTSITLIEGDSQTLTATVSPSNAENQKVLWSSSNSSVASVKEGVVTALKAGNATITAKTDDGGKTAACTVTVEAKNTPVTGVTLDKTSHEMTEGDEVTLTASVSPENATNKNVSWSSSDTSVATVDNGKVTASKVGTATITVKTEDGNKIATCKITVNAIVYSVESVSLNKASHEMTEGDEVNLVAQITPNNATNKNVTWTSSNSTVASVVDGKVTAIKAGAAMITVKTEDGDKTATCEITVNAKTCPVTSVSLDRTAIEMTEGDEVTLTASVSPENATNKNVSWSSSDTSVATVDNGKVTTLKAGVAAISAKTEDGGHTATCLVEVKTKKSKINYVDEYGIDHGLGIDINGVIWAPVNCGYHETDYIYGKLYQWGRRYGQGYSGELWHNDMPTGKQISDTKYPTVDKGTIKEAYVQIEEGQSYFYSDTFFIGKDNWLFPPDSTLWNKGTQLVPIKNEKYDPCPQGWRIPTYEELKFLRDHNCSEWTTNQFGQDGYYYSGTNAFTFDVPHVFFSGSGRRRFTDGDATHRGGCGGYWSSRYKNDEAYLLYIYMGGMRVTSVSCAMGYSIRCVQE